jgi:hypothetical protein
MTLTPERAEPAPYARENRPEGEEIAAHVLREMRGRAFSLRWVGRLDAAVILSGLECRQAQSGSGWNALVYRV